MLLVWSSMPITMKELLYGLALERAQMCLRNFAFSALEAKLIFNFLS